MKLVLAAALAASVASPPPVTGRAADAANRDALLVSPAWLAKHLHDPDLVVLQVGAMSNQQIYDSGHIPGAHMADYDALHGVPKNDAELAARRDALESLGISRHLARHYLQRRGLTGRRPRGRC